MKNTMPRNKFLNKRLFSQCHNGCSPSSLVRLVLKNELDKKIKDIDSNSSEKDIIHKDIIDSIDAKKSIKSDLAKIEPAQKAVEKISNNETPLKKEFTAYADLKDQYQEHLNEDSDSENESDPYVTSSSTNENQLSRLKDLKIYLQGEYKSTVKHLSGLKRLLFKKSDVISVSTEITKRKREESENSESSKKGRQSVHDFVESLPQDYNPFDDNND